MEIRGHIVQKLPAMSGTSSSGNQWKKQEYILETFDQFPRKVLMTLFGDKVDQFSPQFDDAIAGSKDVTVSIDIESRSFTDRNGIERWSTEVRPWKLDLSVADAPNYQSAPSQQQSNYSPASSQPAFVPQPQHAQQQAQTQPQPNDDLPF